MPQKLNRAGQMQNYVPAGNGEASGEYGDNATGSNKHFKQFKKPDDNGTPTVDTTNNGIKEETEREQNRIVETIKRAKDNIVKHCTNADTDKNKETLHKVVDETTDEGKEIINTFMEENPNFTIRFGGAGRGAAGVCYGSSIVVNHEIGTIRHEMGHSFDDMYGKYITKKTMYGYGSHLTTDYLDENGKCLNDYLHEELGVHPFVVDFSNFRMRETKTGKDNRDKKKETAKKIGEKYDEIMDELLDEKTGVKNSRAKIEELLAKRKQLQTIIDQEIVTELAPMNDELNRLRKLEYIRQDEYRDEMYKKGATSIIYSNDPQIKSIRQQMDKIREKYYQESERINNEALKRHSDIMNQNDADLLEKLSSAKRSMWDIASGIDGIVGDTFDYLGLGNYSHYNTRGHGSNYFTGGSHPKSSAYVMEIFANMFDSYLSNDRRKWEFVKKIMPQSSGFFEKIVKQFGTKGGQK